MSGHCKWCDTLTNSIIKIFDGRTLIWSGCPSCYDKKKKAENNE